MQAISILIQYYIRRELQQKINLKFSQHSRWCARMANIALQDFQHLLFWQMLEISDIISSAFLSTSKNHNIFSNLAISKNDNLFFTHCKKTLHPNMHNEPTLLSPLLESHFNISRISPRKALCLPFYGTKQHSKIKLFLTCDKHEKCTNVFIS